MFIQTILFATLFMHSSWALDLNKVEVLAPRPVNAYSLQKAAIAKEQERLSGSISRYLIDFENEGLSSDTVVLTSVLQQRPIVARRIRKSLYEFTEISKLFDHVYLSTGSVSSSAKDSFLYKVPLRSIYSPNGGQSFVVIKENGFELLPIKIIEIQNDLAVIVSRVRLGEIVTSHLSYLSFEFQNKGMPNE